MGVRLTPEQWQGVFEDVRRSWGPARVRSRGWGDWESYYTNPSYMLEKLNPQPFHTTITRMLERGDNDGWPPTPAALIAPIRAEYLRRTPPTPDRTPAPDTGQRRDPLVIIADEIGDTDFGRRYLEWRGRHAPSSP